MAEEQKQVGYLHSFLAGGVGGICLIRSKFVSRPCMFILARSRHTRKTRGAGAACVCDSDRTGDGRLCQEDSGEGGGKPVAAMMTGGVTVPEPVQGSLQGYGGSACR
eukprot:304754-Hanusia_phi.AAC.1